MQNIKNKGFTIVELLVVIAIVAILATITLGYIGVSKEKGSDTGVKSNLATVRALSEIFYIENSNSYLPAGGVAYGVDTCPVYDESGTNMFSIHPTIAQAIAEATRRSTGNSCAVSSEFWAIAMGLNVDPTTSWCIDNQGVAKIVSATAANAINPATFLCN